MIRVFAFAAWFCGATMVYANTTDDRVNRIAEEIRQLSNGLLTGSNIGTPDAQIQTLFKLMNDLTTGAKTLDDLTLAWRDENDELPVKAPGASLVAVGLPQNYTGPIWGTLADGRAIEVIAEVTGEDADTVTVYVPDHPDGDQATGLMTFHFNGVGTLRVEIAPRFAFTNALPMLVRLAVAEVVALLSRNGVNAEALVAQFRGNASSVKPELGYAAAVLYIWSEAGRGDPLWGFLRTGRFEGEFWESLSSNPDHEKINRLYSSALQNSGALGKLMELEMRRGRIERIRYLPPSNGSQQPPQPPSPPKRVSLGEIDDLLVEGRAREYNRKVVLGAAKDAQKVLDYTSFEPITMTSAALLGGVLTMSDKYLRSEDYNYPVTMKLEAQSSPDDLLLADDSRLVYPKVTVSAKGEPLEVRVFSDGLDAGLAVIDIASNFGAVGKALKTLGKAKPTLSIEKQIANALEQTENYWIAKATSVTKDGLEAIEKEGDQRRKGSFNITKLPARTWVAETNARSFFFDKYLSVGYNGEVDWKVNKDTALACWKDTNEGIRATITTKSDKFGGLFDRADATWPVDTPRISLTVNPGRIEPGESAQITAEVSGSEQKPVKFQVPPIGALSGVGELDATYTAPTEVNSCQEFVPLTAAFPTGTRMCVPWPKGSGGVVVAKGDGLIRTPNQLSCRSGEVVGFTVSHPDGAPLQCVLNGPGQLTMVGNEGLLDCPIEPSGPSSITCHTGQQPGQCAPVIPIKRVYPDLSVTMLVSADRRYNSEKLNENIKGIDGIFSDCGIEDATGLALELLDQGTGLADDFPVDPISANCPELVLGGSSGGIGAGGSSNLPEPQAEGPHVAILPLDEARDVTVSDSATYNYSPFTSERIQGDRRIYVSSDITASVSFDGPESFTVTTEGQAEARSKRQKIPAPDSSFADWAVWRRIKVNEDTEVTVQVEVGGPGIALVNVLPTRLVNNVPVGLLLGFDQNPTSAMIVGNSSSVGFPAPPAAISSVILPGPPKKGESIDYAIRFGGRITPNEQGTGKATANTKTRIQFDIRPVSP